MSLNEILIPAAQVREVLGVSRSTLLRMEKDPASGLPSPRYIGRRKHFVRAEVEKYLGDLPTIYPTKSE